ncbi:phosphatidate cytidylyltransferase [Clostridiales bacterium oral taxon 876 str. F0540]|nr:phosphatidate cytidylyltransferase [Clostridiales bacterium oral taxon 876 str. F0540]
MKNNLFGIIISFIFTFLLILLSTILGKIKILSNEGTRKFIHIGVSNWWLIAMYYFNSKFYASIVPVVFIVINYISYRFNVIKAMERNGGKNDLGTVYFPISLFILVLISFSKLSHPYVGALGVLVMGYGDGLAAVVGKKIKSRKFYIAGNEKSIAGTMTMLIVSFITIFIILSIYSTGNVVLQSLILSCFATALEGVTPFGLDNLTVPILTSLFYRIIFY